MAKKPQRFRVSSALKDIIGRELITDDFIAVFELVKNSFDAGASRVGIEFDDLRSNSAKIVIRDNGKGMDARDLTEKWLFVAYSAKREGTEDYRDRIRPKRIHAGAKGIGRFSCDRLGRELTIYSKKSKSTSTLHTLHVNWEDFERDMREEFIDVDVRYRRTRSNPYKLTQGVALEIAGLREEWDRDKLLALKRSLEKLINPSQENDSKNFSIYLNVPEERAADRKISKDQPWNIVNGKVKNRIFEDLGLKTTQIYSAISRDGETITTRLEDRGQLIYEIVEKNPYALGNDRLHDIAIRLFALNRSAKATFARRMGIRLVEYGSVFLYKNGFRVHPFGDMRGGDVFGLDRRKQQHGGSYLGTRDLLGRIEINGDNPGFKETTSRDGGLIKNLSYKQLQEFFSEYALKRLERFSIDVIKYGSDELSDLFSYKDLNRSAIFELIKSLTRSEGILKFHYDPKILDILGEVSEQSLQAILKNFRRLAEETGDPTLQFEAKKAERRIKDLQKAKEDAEREVVAAQRELQEAESRAKEEAARAKEAQKVAEIATQRVEQQTTQNLFLKSMVTSDVSNIVSLHHHIGIAAGAIENYVKSVTRRIISGKPISTDDFVAVLERISYQAKKISSTTRFATKANFTLEATKVEGDLSDFIKEYLLNICDGMIKTSDNKKNIKFRWQSSERSGFITKYRPLEVTIVLDNLISNARKAKATVIAVNASVDGDTLVLNVQDDGVGIRKGASSKIFEMGYTTTNGSGLGLHQIAEILGAMGGEIALTNGLHGGAGFFVRIPRA